MEKEEYFKEWSEKLSLSVEEIDVEFNKLLEDEKNIHANLNEEQHQQRALKRLALVYKKQLRSPAVHFEGIVIGLGDCIDTTARQKREAVELYRADPQTAINERITSESGVPLDTRKEWSTGRANPRYGKPLPENNFLRNIWGIVTKTQSNEQPKFFQMVISGEAATDETLPIFKPVKFMAIDKSLEGSEEYKLNFSTLTKFVVEEGLQLPQFRELIENYIGITKLSELENYHDAMKDDYNRLVVVEADVSALNLEPNSFGSRIMFVEDGDAALEDLETTGLTCWLPERINVDFAEGSKVLVTGRTAQGKKRDDDGNLTEELRDVTLNVYGLYPIPEYKIDLQELTLPTEEDLDDETSQTTEESLEEIPEGLETEE